jgi:hypothetical protein
MAERTAATMTTSFSFFARTAALPEGKEGALWMVVAMPNSVVRCQSSGGEKRPNKWSVLNYKVFIMACDKWKPVPEACKSIPK